MQVDTQEDRRAVFTKKILLSTSNPTNPVPNVLRRYDPKKLNKEGTNQVFLFVHLSGKRVQFQTGVFIKPNQWDNDKGLVKRTCKECGAHNLELARLEGKITEIMVRLRLKDIPLTLELLQFEYSKPSYGFDFIDFMDRAIKERIGVDIVQSTANHHAGVLSKLKTFKNPILSDEVSDEFITRYAKYLGVTLGNKQNSVHGNIKTIKAYVNRAIEAGLLENKSGVKNPVKVVACKTEFLTDQEYRAMVDLYRKGTLSSSLQSVLRWYLFCCNTGIRMSDLRRIKMDQIFKDILILVPKKSAHTTGKTVKIPLMKFALQLIKDEGDIHMDGLVFNCISEVNMREFIKLIATKHCKLKKSLNWHSSRHTFATIFLRNNPGDVVTLQKLMGQSKIEDVLRYLHIDTADVTKAMLFQDEY
jgi:integrase